jgi:hypothetical protein
MVASGPDRNRRYGSGWWLRRRIYWMKMARKARIYNIPTAAHYVTAARSSQHQRIEALRYERTL